MRNGRWRRIIGGGAAGAIAAGLAIVGLLLGAVWLFRTEIATALMGRAARTGLATDTVAELRDGLHVAFCGAGSPFPDPTRSGPCIAVIAGRTLVVVDAGAGGVRNLQRMGIRAGGIAAVLLTHFHSDHIDGLGELALQRWIGAAHAEPLPVYGPTGVEEVVAGFNQAYRADSGYRTAHHGERIAPPAGAGMRAMPFTVAGSGQQEIWNARGLRITAFSVAHAPVHPAVGYRFEYGGRALVISGDTRRADAVADAARGADLLLHEALDATLLARLTAAAEAAGRHDLAQITRDIVDYHTSPVAAAEVAATAQVDALVLYHVVPPLLVPGAETAFLRGVGDAFHGTVAVARDGTQLSLPADSDMIERSQWL
jgi:ribonuclease Z